MKKNNQAKKIIYLMWLVVVLMLIPSLGLASIDTTLMNPLGEGVEFTTVVGRVLNYALAAVGMVALVVFIIGGLMWMTSGGNETKIKKGKDTLVYASLGIIVIFSSYALIKFIFEMLAV